MPIDIQDVLKVNVVLAGTSLLSEPHQQEAFANWTDTEVVKSVGVGPLPVPALIGNFPENEFTFTLPRDRIELVSQQAQSAVEREYPTTIGDLDRLVEVTSQAIDLTGPSEQSPDAYGFNIQLVYLPTVEEPSGKYLAKRLFRQFDLAGWALTGGSGQLSFTTDGTQYNFIVESRGKDPMNRKVFLSLNLHKDRQEMPSRNDIEVSLRDIWVRSEQFANQLDASE